MCYTEFMRIILTSAAAAILASAVATPASAECTCRGRNGVEVFLGETVCLPTPNGPRMARCEMVLNNSSWTFLNDPCPQAMSDQLLNVQTAQSSPAPNMSVAR